MSDLTRLQLAEEEIRLLRLQIELHRKAEDRHMHLRNLYASVVDHHSSRHPDCFPSDHHKDITTL